MIVTCLMSTRCRQVRVNLLLFRCKREIQAKRPKLDLEETKTSPEEKAYRNLFVKLPSVCQVSRRIHEASLVDLETVVTNWKVLKVVVPKTHSV